MAYIHILPVQHWDYRTQSFRSVAFKPSSDDGGISVFEKQCSESASSTVCIHIDSFYPHVVGSDAAGYPTVYWEIPNGLLPPKILIEQCVSDRGDICHHNLKRLTKKEARKFFKDKIPEGDISRFLICNEHCGRPATEMDTAAWDAISKMQT